MQSVPREWLDFLRQQFPKDSRIQLTEIGGNPRPISPGSTGKLDYIDDAGQFHVKWDNGCTLALVLGEDRFSVYLPEPQTFKLYMPLTADFYGRDEWGDMSEDGEEWDGHTLMDYEGQILSALVKNRVPEENESGLMRWYGEDDSVDHKVRSAVFTVEVRNRQLWGVAECRVAGELTPEELTILKEYLGGQASDGWGEGFEQRPIEVDGGELYVHLWQPDDWSIQTEQERFAPKVAEGLPELCFSTLRTTGQLICIKRGETGYYPSDWDTGDKEGNVELADELNEDLGVTPIQRQAIVNPQNMQKEDFVKGGTATGPMLDFLAACLRYGVSVCVAGATGSGKTTVAGWLLTTIPDNKRIFTIENGSRELDLVREKDGRVCNSVIHTITRESENAKQNIDQDMLLDMALRYHPDIICVGEMRSAEAYAAQEAARTGHGVLTTIHSNSSQATWRRMVTLCKRKHEMADDTLMDLVTEAFPIVVFAKQLEDKSRKIMEIMECEILPTGERRYNTLYHFKIEENRLEDGKYRIKGRHEAVNPISESLQKRFIDNGMPQEVLTQLVGKKSAPSKGKSGSSPAKAGQATPAPKTRSAQSKPPAKPETGKEGGESV